MPIETTPTFVTEPAADAQFVAVPFGRDLAPPADLPLPVDALLAHYEAKGEPGEVVEVPVALGSGIRRVLLYGVGGGSAADLRKAGASVTRKVKGGARVWIRVPETGDAAALAEGALLASYTFRIGAVRTPPDIAFVGGDEKALRRGETVARATALARDLVNTPASIKSPAWLADQAREVAASAGLGFREDSALDGFGGIRAVGQGSAHPPRLVELTYAPEGATRHVVLVGKGITFDTGGLSLKPEEGMKTMKTDMAGGAAVIAVMGALATAGVPVRVTGLVACAENAFSGSAQRPGDVITQYGGRTVEVLNTDAEGRLVLADALAYADAELAPDILIDIATLTGAAKIALGLRLGALYATDDPLAAELVAAGEATGERLWRMPLIDDYRADLDSDIADLANVDRKMSGSAGSVAAALFLREFAGGRPWAHLDVAGPARATADDGEITKGGTGFGVRLLLSYLASLG
ncbi:leucyl aminopeptidase family protein [Microtetraspora malaysiensis]|uniref:leucyl aminopeptidase family protein n=1 Tax=Microtetraspora malaysiensis TaxID=161358 RepID=UPI003D920359